MEFRCRITPDLAGFIAAQTSVFLMDYANRRRIKLWGTARVVEDDPALIQALRPEGHAGIPEQAILFDVGAWDANGPQRFEAADVAAALARRDARRIAELEAELARR